MINNSSKAIVKYIDDLTKNIMKDIKRGGDLLEIAEKYDEYMEKSSKICGLRPQMPLSLEPGPILNNFSPYQKYLISKNDIISFTITLVDRDRRIYKLARTRRIDKMNTRSSLITRTLKMCAQVAIGTFKPGNHLTAPSEQIERIMDEEYMHTVVNITGYCLTNDHKIIPNMKPLKAMYKYLQGTMLVGERYYLNIYVTNQSVHVPAVKFSHPTMYKINIVDNKILKIKLLRYKDSVRRAINKLNIKYSRGRVFSGRILSASGIRQADIQKLYDEDIILAIGADILKSHNKKSKINKRVGAHVGYTIEITENGNKIIC